MSAGDRLIQPGSCSWCSHPAHPGKLCPVTVEYPVTWGKITGKAPAGAPKPGTKTTVIDPCRCKIGAR